MKSKDVIKRVLPIALVLLVLWFFLRDMTVEDILSFTPENPILAAGIILLLFALKSQIMVLPVIVIYMAAGLLFSAPVAILVCCLGLLLEGSLCFLVGRRFRKRHPEGLAVDNKMLRRVLMLLGDNLYALSFVVRLTPISFELASLYLTVSGIAYLPFVLLSLLGSLPIMIACILAGDAIHTPLSAEFLVPLVIAVVLAIIPAGLMIWLEKRRKAKAAAAPADEPKNTQ